MKSLCCTFMLLAFAVSNDESFVAASRDLIPSSERRKIPSDYLRSWMKDAHASLKSTVGQHLASALKARRKGTLFPSFPTFISTHTSSSDTYPDSSRTAPHTHSPRISTTGWVSSASHTVRLAPSGEESPQMLSYNAVSGVSMLQPEPKHESMKPCADVIKDYNKCVKTYGKPHGNKGSPCLLHDKQKRECTQRGFARPSDQAGPSGIFPGLSGSKPVKITKRTSVPVSVITPAMRGKSQIPLDEYGYPVGTPYG
mmetsp:Transcript_16695/g.23020  ORF Transcript_16695/g.23020 Transcript_16695/m.23020 type:complete len:255 (+) Transcript_16695:60-824(+)